MKKILIIDDSALMRRVMSDIIKSEPGMTVANTADNGSTAVKYLEDGKRYDCILLDINMPKMDGIGFLTYINEKRITMPVLVVSSIASQSTKETMRALELGAYDFVKKPDGVATSEFKDQLLQKVKCAFGLKPMSYQEPVIRRQTETHVAKPVPRLQRWQGTSGIRGTIIFIASSTGGPKALQSVVPRFPKNIGCPIVVVQHMPEGFTGSLAERLNEMSQCQVKEAVDGEILQNGVVYVAKGGYQLRVEQKRNEHSLVVRKEEPRGGLRPCADIFLESLMGSGYQRIFCGILTGMGSDGTKGLLQLKQMKKVYTVGQSEGSCVVYGMPRAAVKADVVDEVADLQKVADLLIAAMQQNGG
ncbi:MAG: chemotaxis-specific protein-glutamate methyltransferase CheB [Eubacterium sp.]|nr:chemotaxis-specific protein-glutamate methyltransferase CheB [Eubacterium sp.]